MTTLNRYLLLLFAAALAALLAGGPAQPVKSPARAAAHQVPG